MKLYIKSRGEKIKAIDLVSQVFDQLLEIVTINYKHAGEVKTITLNGNSYELYKSLDAYKKGDKLVLFPTKDFIKNLNRKDEANELVYYVENGNICSTSYADTKLTSYYSEDGTTTSYIGNEETNYYCSKEELFKYEDFAYIDEDGNEQTNKSIASNYEYTPKQLELIDELQKIVEECRINGLEFANIGWGGDCFVYPKKLDVYEYDDNEEDYEIFDEWKTKLKTIYIDRYNDEAALLMKKRN